LRAPGGHAGRVYAFPTLLSELSALFGALSGNP
jgi:hypothetical protein